MTNYFLRTKPRTKKEEIPILSQAKVQLIFHKNNSLKTLSARNNQQEHDLLTFWDIGQDEFDKYIDYYILALTRPRGREDWLLLQRRK